MDLKGTKIFLCTLAVVSLLFSFTTSRSTNRHASIPGNKDTASAVVAYGENYLFDTAQMVSANNLARFIDSIEHLDSLSPDLQQDLDVFKSVRNKEEDFLLSIIDSLFQLKEVPYALINQINLYISKYEVLNLKEEEFPLFDVDSNGYPANELYQHWNNKLAFDYSPQLASTDTTVILRLIDPSTNYGYHHPIGKKTIARYMGMITSPFGWRDGRAHKGVDLELHYWDSIYCMFPGKVRMAKNYAGYGKVVIVRHQNGLETLYAHMSKIKVKEGQEVDAGSMLGHGGATGNATGVHLHMEIRYKGVPLNPSHIISFKDRELHGEVLVLKKQKNGFIAYPLGTEIHTVQRGEYASKIAKRYGISLNELCEMNGITTKTRLKVGEQLRVMSTGNSTNLP